MIRTVQYIISRQIGMVKRLPGETIYKEIPKDKLKFNMLKNSLQASHCMVYAINKGKIKLDDKEYCTKANILMHLRYDGCIGFPGGYVDEGENAEEAVMREIKEEMSTDMECFKIDSNDHVISHYSSEKNLVVHLYAKEVSLGMFTELEKNSLKGNDYGIEVMGVLRIPLYTMVDSFGGFPSFLHNKFIGNSKQQLCYALIARGIMTEDDVNNALTARPV